MTECSFHVSLTQIKIYSSLQSMCQFSTLLSQTFSDWKIYSPFLIIRLLTHSNLSMISNRRYIYCRQGALWSGRTGFPIMAKISFRSIILSVMTPKTFSSSTTRRGYCKNIVASSSFGEGTLTLLIFLGFSLGFLHRKKKLLLIFAQFSVLSGPLKAVSVVWKQVRNLCIWEAESGDTDFRPES